MIRGQGGVHLTVDIRRASAQDTGAIRAICAQIWDGDDYLPNVLDHWINDPDGEFCIVEIDGEIGAMGKLTVFSSGDGWLEGLRGNPAHKGRGLAKLLTAHLIERARARNLKSLRLATYQDNDESRHIIASYGFYEIGRFVYFEHVAASDAVKTARRVAPDEKAELWQRVMRSEAIRLAGGFVSRGWQFFPISESWFDRLVESGEVWVTPSGAAGSYNIDEHSEGWLQLNLLCEGDGDIADLLSHATGQAAERGFKGVLCNCPDNGRLIGAFFEAGFYHFDPKSQTVGYTLLLARDI